MNILFVSHDAHANGAQILLLVLAAWLKEHGLVNPRFILAGPGSLSEEFMRLGPVLRLEGDQQRGAASDATTRLLKSFCGDEVAAVYLNSAASGHVIELTRHLQVPQIAHVHELQKSIDRWVGVAKMSALREHADLFIAASGPVADNLYENHAIPRERLKVVHAFIGCSGVRRITVAEKRTCKSALGLNPDAKVVLGCGTTDWRKGPDLFVQVAEAACLNNPGEIEFLWVGGETREGEIEELEQLARSKGVGERIRFIREVLTPFPFMLAADVFLLPSREDPFPLVCLEAADCGVPIICFAEAGGMPHFVGSTCGTVVPYLDVRAMADELNSFLRDEEKTRRRGEAAREKVRTQFDVSVRGREIYDILKTVCAPAAVGVDSAPADI